jgi:hypothetical protein
MSAGSLHRVDLRGWIFTCRVHSGHRAAFQAIYDGERRGAAQRGIAAVLAQGVDDDDGSRIAAVWAAHAFADGYFGAAPTLSPARAAGKALEAINSWLFGQGWSQPDQPKARVGFGAVLLVGRRLRFVTAADRAIYLWREGKLLPLEGVTEPSPASPAPTPLGASRDIAMEYFDVEAQVGDRYVLMTGSATWEQIEVVCLGATPSNGLQAALLLLDIEQLPHPGLGDINADFGNLPLRDPPQQGETLDGFAIGRTIYRSRYTLLRRAFDTIEMRDVVMKFPLRAMLQDKVFQAGFLREVWVGRSINSKRVAEYLTPAPGRQSCLYIVLPFYRGETLEERLSHGPPVNFAEGISIALRLCEAVNDLDRLQIVHRDLKPENIVLPNEGGLRLLDLGLAYLPGLDDSTEDRLGGTTRYMAPELFRGSPPDQRSEVFSLGVTIYRTFSGGHFPFGQWERQPLSRWRPDLPAWLGQSLGQALADNVALRFANAAMFAQALEAGLKEGSSAPVPRPSWRLWAGSLLFWKILTACFAVAFFVALLVIMSRR